MKSRRLLFVVAGCVVGVAAIGLAADYFWALPAGREAKFVGRESCAECHRAESEAWNGSDHDLAMDLATPETVLGNFDHQEFTHFGITSTMDRDGDKFFVTTENAAGKLEKFAIKYVFGVRPLQQYMVEFPDGRVQVLSIAWDVKGKRWFDLHPDERVPPGDELHWTKPASNWNYMCAECHSTNLQKNFDVKSNTYHTTFSEIDVSCEACHGPASLHVEIAKNRRVFWDRRYGYGLAQLKTTANKAQVDACARCHARRRVVHGDYLPGHEFLDFYQPELIEQPLYTADGQIRDEVYEYGSFHQSRMYRENVRCSDCHDPHSLKLRFEGNQLCLRCHTLAKGNYDSPTHHHHKFESAGGQCVNCHMPERTYMVIDPRRDHSLRVPRPDLTVKYGVPNACNDCHVEKTDATGKAIAVEPNDAKVPKLPTDKAAQWAADKVVEWYGPVRKQSPYHEHLAHAAAAPADEANRLLRELAQDRPGADKAVVVPDIVRATAINMLSRIGGTNAQLTFEKALTDRDPLVRATAVQTFDMAGATSPEQQAELRRRLMPLLGDPIRLVRTEAAKVLTHVQRGQMTADQARQLDAALAELRAGLQATNDDAGPHMIEATVYFNQGQLEKARDEYKLAIMLARNGLQAGQSRMQLATVEHALGNNAEAERLFREVIKIEPRYSEAWYNLGLVIAENESRLSDATEALRQAAQLSPNVGRVQYNLGLALQKLGRTGEAEQALTRACTLEPQVSAYLYATAVLYAQLEKWREAAIYAKRLLDLEPRPEYQQLFRMIQQRAGGRP
ncbi:MAG: tetratricopeptide repeat protein [Planctomycetes bacterium]|nr:tetratricopeptide repeat protein [Planctomycetota bacterium]